MKARHGCSWRRKGRLGQWAPPGRKERTASKDLRAFRARLEFKALSDRKVPSAPLAPLERRVRRASKELPVLKVQLGPRERKACQELKAQLVLSVCRGLKDLLETPDPKDCVD